MIPFPKCYNDYLKLLSEIPATSSCVVEQEWNYAKDNIRVRIIFKFLKSGRGFGIIPT